VRRNRVLATTSALLAFIAAGTGVAVANSDNGDATVSGPQARQATSAALDATRGGRANSVERDSENGATWEVEITKPDGTTVDVRLDEKYNVVVIEGDHEPERG
jgi:uncharacterized membrane protein YkoI